MWSEDHLPRHWGAGTAVADRKLENKMKLAAILAALGVTMLIYNVPHLWRDDGSGSDHAHGVFFGVLFLSGAVWRLFGRDND